MAGHGLQRCDLGCHMGVIHVGTAGAHPRIGYIVRIQGPVHDRGGPFSVDR